MLPVSGLAQLLALSQREESRVVLSENLGGRFSAKVVNSEGFIVSINVYEGLCNPSGGGELQSETCPYISTDIGGYIKIF